MINLVNNTIKKTGYYAPPLEGRRAFNGVLLDFNERSVAPSAKARAALKWLAQSNELQTYPEYGDLNKLISAYVGVSPDQILITNGSDQGIDIIFRAFRRPGANAIIPTPSFAMFNQCAGIENYKIVSPVYNNNEKYPLKEVLNKINNQTAIIVVCNPNNPTGTLLKISEIKTIANKAKRSIVLVDEAYAEFSGVSVIKLIKQFPNIIVVRTFSKAFGLGSLRLGYIVARPEYIKEFSKIRGPYDVNMAACYAARGSLNDLSTMKKYVNQVMQRAKPLVEKFFKTNQIKFLQSRANIILFWPKNSKATYNILKEKGFLVRPQNKPTIEDSLRLTIGTLKQMQAFIKIYQNKIIKQKYAILDRDGTLIYEPPTTKQVDSQNKLKILPGAINSLKLLTSRGYKLIMVTNQDGLGTNKFPSNKFTLVQTKLLKIFKQKNIVFEEVFICPHFAKDNCSCRKPKAGLIRNWLIKNYQSIDYKNSLVCGDRLSDKQFAKNIKIRFINTKTNKKLDLTKVI